MNWWDILKRELRQMFIKDPRRVLYLFGACAVYILLFGLLYSTHVLSRVPLVIYDQDQTRLSRSLIQAFEDSERYQIAAYVNSQEEMEEYLHTQKALTSISIPPDFSRTIKTGHSSSILAAVNGTNLIIANSVLSSVQEIILTFSNNTGGSLIEFTGQLPEQALHKVAPVTLELRILYNSTLSYLDFFVLGLAMAALQQGILLAVGASMISEYQNIGELNNVPVWHVISGKFLPYWLCGTLSFIMALSLSALAFNIPFKGSFISLLALGTVFSFTITAFASVLGAICHNEVSFTQFSLAYAVPAFIFSGYTWPQHSMDAISLAISYIFPLTYFADTIRDLMISGHAPSLGKNILLLLSIGTVLLIISTLMYIYRRKHSSDLKQNNQLSPLKQ